MELGRRGRAEPPAGFSPLDAVSMSASDAQRDITLRQRLADWLLKVFMENHARLHQLLTEFGPAEWETPCWHAGRGPMPARNYVDLRLQELVIHDWDIRAAKDPAANLDPEGARALLPVAQTWPAMTLRPGVKLEAPFTFRFDVSGHPSVCHDVTAGGESFEIKTQETSPADVTISCDRDSYLLLAYGRLDASGKGGSGRLDIQGNARLMDLSSSGSKFFNLHFLRVRHPGSAEKSVAPTKRGALAEASGPYRCASRRKTDRGWNAPRHFSIRCGHGHGWLSHRLYAGQMGPR